MPSKKDAATGLTERLLAVLEAQRGLGADAYPLTLRRLVELTQLDPIVPDEPAWYGSMAHVPLSPTDTNETCAVANPLQHTIWQKLGIEVLPTLVKFAIRHGMTTLE